MQLTEHQKTILKARISVWREKAEQVGSQHANWDKIADAEALLRGQETVLSGTPQEVYDQLMGMR